MIEYISLLTIPLPGFNHQLVRWGRRDLNSLGLFILEETFSGRRLFLNPIPLEASETKWSEAPFPWTLFLKKGPPEA
jgi:hypothetical protein